MKINKTRMICEAAIFIAMAEILSLIKLYEFPNGGSITLEMLPIILFAARYACSAGFCVAAMAASYADRASALRPSRRRRSARAACQA